MLEHRYDIRMWESCVEPNLLMVERQDPDNCIRFQTRERCALEKAAYVFKSYLFTDTLVIYYCSWSGPPRSYVDFSQDQEGRLVYVRAAFAATSIKI